MQSELISKFSNIYIMLLYSIMTEDIDRVKHFLSDEIYEKYKNIIEENKKNNEIQMYDELNISKIKIINHEKTNDKEMVEVQIEVKYMDYVIDKITKQYKRGNTERRKSSKKTLYFEKSININRGIIVECPSCGASMDTNFTGKCNYCRNVIDLNGSDYMLTKII